MRFISCLVFVSFLFFLNSCNSEKKESFEKNAITYASSNLKKLTDWAVKEQKCPRSSDENGTIRWLQQNYDWTEGFFPGSLWLMYEATNDEIWKTKALFFQQLFESHKDQKNDHDMGFIFNCSFGNAYRLTNNDHFKSVLIDAANSLMKSYNPKIGLIMSWDVKQEWVKKLAWQYPVIIDNMMNLELLFEATILTHDSVYYKAAVAHANKTMANHFRNDFSTYHVLDYDSISGVVRSKQTNQGFADESAWARGQAWGLYGFTMCYRYTKDEKYLVRAQQIAAFLINHPRLPEDKIPYWDFDAPDIPHAQRDVSAAAIMASALLELNAYTHDNEMKEVARSILESLSKNYVNTSDDKSVFILKHSVGNMPINSEIDVSINYADYYYLEALLRLNR